MIRKIVFLLIFLLSILPSHLIAGWVITEKISNSPGYNSYQTIFIQNKMVRYDGATMVSIMNLENQKITLLFSQHKAYWQGSAHQLSSQFRSVMLKQLQMLIQHAPESEKDTLRKVFIRMRSGKDTLPVESKFLPIIKIKNLNQNKKIAGYNASAYQIFLDSIPIEKIWYTTQIRPYENVDVKKLIKLSKAINPASPAFLLTSSSVYINLLKNGLILKRIFKQKDKTDKVTTVVKVRNLHINDGIFEIPYDYLPITLNEVMQLDINRDILNSKSNISNSGTRIALPPPFPKKNKEPFKNKFQ